MDGLVAYILAKKLIGEMSSQISSITSDGSTLTFALQNGETIEVTIPPVGSLEFTLPEEGSENTLYFVDGKIQAWNPETQSYYNAGGKELEWHDLGG